MHGRVQGWQTVGELFCGGGEMLQLTPLYQSFSYCELVQPVLPVLTYLTLAPMLNEHSF